VLNKALLQRRKLRHLRNLLDVAAADRAAAGRASAGGGAARELLTEARVAALRAAFRAEAGGAGALPDAAALARVLAAAGLDGRRFNAAALFAVLDADADGGVSERELLVGLSHLVADGAGPGELLALVFAAFDDGTGALGARALLELLAAMGVGGDDAVAAAAPAPEGARARAPAARALPRAAAWRSPARSDGPFVAGAASLVEHAAALFARADENKDGALSFAEFSNVCAADPLLRALLIDRDDEAAARLAVNGVPPPLPELEKEAAALAAEVAAARARAAELEGFAARVADDLRAARAAAAAPPAGARLRREHGGAWRDIGARARYPGGSSIRQYCSTSLEEGPLCRHEDVSGSDYEESHWSCCGSKARVSECSPPRASAADDAAPADAGARPRVGDRVKLSPAGREDREALGARADDRVGVVERDDRSDDRPIQVRGENGVSSWYDLKDLVVLVASFKVGDRVRAAAGADADKVLKAAGSGVVGLVRRIDSDGDHLVCALAAAGKTIVSGPAARAPAGVSRPSLTIPAPLPPPARAERRRVVLLPRPGHRARRRGRRARGRHVRGRHVRGRRARGRRARRAPARGRPRQALARRARRQRRARRARRRQGRRRRARRPVR